MGMTITIPNVAPAARVATAIESSKLHVQVLSAAGVFVRIAKSRDELDNPLPFSGPIGYTFDSTAGIIELQWQGEVWMEGLASNASNPLVTVDVTPT
jgi:hypothetical protein